MHTHPVLLVPGVGTVEELQGHVVVLVEPLHDKGLEPGRVLGHLPLVRRHVSHVRLEQPFHPAKQAGLASKIVADIFVHRLEIGR